MKIAVVKLSALGDIVHAMVALQFIKQQRPEVEIDWIVEQAFKPLLEYNPDIRQIHTVQLKKLKQQRSLSKLWAQVKQLRQLDDYDVVLDAQGLLKSAILSALLKSKKVVGFDRNSIREKPAALFYDETVTIPYHANTIDRNVAVLCRPLGIKVSANDIINKQPFLFYRSEISVPSSPYIILVIGSTWESRNYPKESYVEVARQLNKPCWVTWGNEDERKKAEWMAEQAENIHVLPKLTLDDLKKLIDHADLVIGNDTGPTHMAWGLNRPSITLFGPTPISRIYQTPINKAIKSPSQVDPYALNKQDFSIQAIAPERIISEANKLF
jgi:heptosyltransferase-1